MVKMSFRYIYSLIIVLSTLFFYNICAAKDINYIKSKEDISKTFSNSIKEKVIIYFDFDCPVCRSYTDEIINLSKKFDSEYDFYLVFTYLTSDEELKNSNTFDSTNIKILYDNNLYLAKKLKTTIVPTAIILTKNNKIRYFGCIDNSFESVTVMNNNSLPIFYLYDALIDKFLEKKTYPIGCKFR
jgi:thiol-disulfide isomerase/thioredoxin